LKEILSYEEVYEAVGRIIEKINQSAESKATENNGTGEE
jgi:hypothetical protein